MIKVTCLTRNLVYSFTIFLFSGVKLFYDDFMDTKLGNNIKSTLDDTVISDILLVMETSFSKQFQVRSYVEN